MKKTLMCWGFECGNGWYELIYSISALLSNHNPDIKAVQVKEKFGDLRFYHDHHDDYTGGVVGMAGYISSHTCETCGAPGQEYSREGWIITACGEHKDQNSRGRKVEPTPNNLLSLIDTPPIEGIGQGWMRLVALLKIKSDWGVEHNGMQPVTFQFTRDENGLLHVGFSGGSGVTQGMVDLVNHYAGKIDEHSGRILSELTIRFAPGYTPLAPPNAS
ncbi:hypothetical protein [Methylomicrobium lacus]|uniref:hypothetical protein n=1 Tax=Methylomicrobium lacus TaxID=136992 RepID=UPI0035A86DE3